MIVKDIGEWRDFSGGTWNPVTGCEYKSPGCKNCYARHIAMQKFREGDPKYRNNFKCTLHPEMLKRLPPMEEGGSIFFCSMADIFQDAVPDEFIFSVFDCIRRWKGRHFNFLTKRAERMAALAPRTNRSCLHGLFLYPVRDRATHRVFLSPWVEVFRFARMNANYRPKSSGICLWKD